MAPTRRSAPADRDGATNIPPLPMAVLDPRPVLAVGTGAWLAGLVVTLVVGADSRQIALCAVGVAVGVVGWLIYVVQRRAVRRGHAGAQQGIARPRRS